MKKSKSRDPEEPGCPVCVGRLRSSIDIKTNLVKVWCPSPSCCEKMNLGADGRTGEDAYKALKALVGQ